MREEHSAVRQAVKKAHEKFTTTKKKVKRRLHKAFYEVVKPNLAKMRTKNITSENLPSDFAENIPIQC